MHVVEEGGAGIESMDEEHTKDEGWRGWREEHFALII